MMRIRLQTVRLLSTQQLFGVGCKCCPVCLLLGSAGELLQCNQAATQTLSVACCCSPSNAPHETKAATQMKASLGLLLRGRTVHSLLCEQGSRLQ